MFVNTDIKPAHRLLDVFPAMGGLHVGVEWFAPMSDYFNRIGVGDYREALWINDAALQMEQAGIFQHLYSWFPFWGGFAYAHAMDAIRPSEPTSLFIGSPLHNNLGTRFTMSGSYMDLGFNATVLPIYDNTLSFYCNINRVISSFLIDLGSLDSATSAHNLAAATRFTTGDWITAYDNSTRAVSAVQTTSSCMMHGVISASNKRSLYRNGVLETSNNSITTGTVPASNYTLGYVTSYSYTLQRYCDVSIFKKGLTDAQVQEHHRIINQLETRLNRNY